MTFYYTTMARKPSSAFEVVAHNYNDNTLYLQFKNSNERIYENVPESVFNLMIQSDSLGRFYNKHIAGHFSSIPAKDGELVSVFDALRDEKPTAETTGYEWPSLTTNTTNEPVEENVYEPATPDTRFLVCYEDESDSTGGTASVYAADWVDAVNQFNKAVLPAVEIGVLKPLVVTKVIVEIG